jgi:hypothetical protein
MHQYAHDVQGEKWSLFHHKQKTMFIDNCQTTLRSCHGCGASGVGIDKCHLAEDLSRPEDLNQFVSYSHLDIAIQNDVHDPAGGSFLKYGLAGLKLLNVATVLEKAYQIHMAKLHKRHQAGAN